MDGRSAGRVGYLIVGNQTAEWNFSGDSQTLLAETQVLVAKLRFASTSDIGVSRADGRKDGKREEAAARTNLVKF